MALKLKIKKGATVEVIAGAEKGKKGAVIEINTNKMKIRVQGVRVQKVRDRKEGRIEREGFIDYSNVKLIKGPDAAEGKKKTEKKGAKKKASATA